MFIELAKNDSKFLFELQLLKDLGDVDNSGLLARYLKSNIQVHVNDAINESAQKIRSLIVPTIATLKKQFESPKIVLKKRFDKELDYDRYRGLLARNEKIDPTLKASVEAYESIHAELQEGLPIFLQLCQDFVYIILDQFMEIQMEFYDKVAKVLQSTLNEVGLDQIIGPKSILDDFKKNMEIGSIAERSCAAITMIKPWHDTIWKSREYTLTPAIDLIELSSPKSAKATGFFVKCKYEFLAEFDEELTIIKNDRIQILNDDFRSGSDEWWYGESKRGKGWFPRSFVEQDI